MANESDAALSGGLLVVLGIIVAVVVGYLFMSGKMGGGSGAPDVVKVEMPKVEAPKVQ